MRWYYPILLAPVYLLLLLPLPVLYLFSDLVFLLLFHVSGYRRKVVYANLRASFPAKNDAEIHDIARKYYHHMVDVIFETLKLCTISRKELLSRAVFENIDLVNQFKEKGQSFLFVLGHMGNWEWMGPSFSQNDSTKLYALYHPLSNRFFDWFVYRLRTRFGGGLIPMNNLLREMTHLRNEYCAIAFIADQTPMPEHAYWVDFLNQDTPVFVGIEKIARRFNYPVVYVSTVKRGRGKYTSTFKLVSQEPKHTADGEITRLHTAMLEQDINQSPSIWLWSHRRWKHKRPVKA